MFVSHLIFFDDKFLFFSYSIYIQFLIFYVYVCLSFPHRICMHSAVTFSCRIKFRLPIGMLDFLVSIRRYDCVRTYNLCAIKCLMLNEDSSILNVLFCSVCRILHMVDLVILHRYLV